jgi:hypothetical protein
MTISSSAQPGLRPVDPVEGATAPDGLDEGFLHGLLGLSQVAAQGEQLQDQSGIRRFIQVVKRCGAAHRCTPSKGPRSNDTYACLPVLNSTRQVRNARSCRAQVVLPRKVPPCFDEAVQVSSLDERRLQSEYYSADFVVYIYEDGDAPGCSWSVDSYLLSDTDVPEVLKWLSDRVPDDACWSLGLVVEPQRCTPPTPESALTVAWIVGADLLNVASQELSPEEQATAEAMLARRHRVALP